MRDLRTAQHISGQRIEAEDVLKRIGDLAYRDHGVMSKAMLSDKGKAIIVGGGLRAGVVASGVPGMTINITAGAVCQRQIHTGTEADVFPCFEPVLQTVALDAATGVDRVDIIEGCVKVRDVKTDTVQVATGATIVIANASIKRDNEYYLHVQKKTSSTTPTAATRGTLTGTVAIAGVIDLSAKYLLNVMDGEDGSYVEINCQGAVPNATTLAEIITKINTAMGRTMASVGAGNVLKLTGDGYGIASTFRIKPPFSDASKDCLAEITGLSSGGLYKYAYYGTNQYFKLAEIAVGAAAVAITNADIKNVDEKSGWVSGADDILVYNTVFDEIETLENPGILRNAVINGNMRIAFDGYSFVSPSSGDSLLSRWIYGRSATPRHTISRVADSPLDELYGSLKVECTTLNDPVGVADYSALVYLVEGFDFRPYIGKTATLSFWVKAVKTGTYCISFRNSGLDRSYVAEYPVHTSGVWEKKTIPIIFDYTGGTWDYLTGTGISILFCLAAGTNYHTTADAWQNGNYFSTVNQVNETDNVANDFYLAGVQLNIGDRALPYYHRTIKEEERGVLAADPVTPIAGYLDDGTPFYRYRSSLSWNMDSTGTKSIAFSLGGIIQITARVANNAGSIYQFGLPISSSGTACPGTFLWTVGTITFHRVGGGAYDAAAFNAATLYYVVDYI